MLKRVDIAREVIAGYWGSGDTRTAKLKKEGYNVTQVQDDVNTILCCRENIINNIKAMAVTMSNNNKWHYIYFNEKYGKECAICHPHNGENKGWQCIGAVMAAWHHGGLSIPCNCGTIDNGTWEAILNAKNDATALRIARQHLKIDDITVIRNKNGIPKEKAQPGDMAALYVNGNEFQHTYMIMSNNTIFDSTQGATDADDIRADRNFGGRYVSCMKVLIRYTGKGICPVPKRTIEQLAQEVIEGLWGSGDSRVKALKEAGHDAKKVQTKVNELLKSPTKKEEKKDTTKKKYTGKIPTSKLVKSNEEVKADAIKWAKWIANNNEFHYGYGIHAHHNGCYFCGTQPKTKKNAGIKDYEHTYCCNPFVGAAWAHGGCVPQAIALCRKGSSWDFGKGKGYDASSLFTNLGKPDKSKLKAGDVLCNDSHVALYIGGGKIAEASGGDDNRKNSEKWNNSLHITTLTDSRYKGFKRVHRYNGSINTTASIYHGEVSVRVKNLQEFLNWYTDGDFFKKCGKADGVFGDNTLKYVKAFQKSVGITEDGIVGPNTFNKIKEFAA